MSCPHFKGMQSSSPRGHRGDSKKPTFHFTLISHFYNHSFIATPTLPLPLPLPPISRHNPKFTIPRNKRYTEANLSATGRPFYDILENKKKLCFCNVLIKIKSISCPTLEKTRSCPIPQIFYGLCLSSESCKKLRAYTDQKFGV